MTSGGDEFLKKGNENFVDENYEEALKNYNLAIEADPSQSEFFLKRGICCYVLDDYEMCLKNMDSALQIDPQNSRALLRKGMALMALGNTEDAFASFTRGQEIDPGSSVWLPWLKRCEEELSLGCVSTNDLTITDRQKGETFGKSVLGWTNKMEWTSDQGFSDVSTAIPPNIGSPLPPEPQEQEIPAADPNLPIEERAMKEKNLGNEAIAKHQYEEAIVHYTRAIALQPSNHILYTNRAAAYFRDHRLEESLQDAFQSIKLNNKWAKGYYRAGTVQIQFGHIQEGLDILLHGNEICQGNKDLETAIEIGGLFLEAKKKGFDLRAAPPSALVSSNVQQNRQTLEGEKFAELSTAVTMTLSGDRTRCVRQGFVDQMGLIVSIDSSVSDQTIISRLNSGAINQVYFFVIFSRNEEGVLQEFTYKEPRPSGETAPIPLSAIQLDVLDLTMVSLGQNPDPNPYITQRLAK